MCIIFVAMLAGAAIVWLSGYALSTPLEGIDDREGGE